MNFKKTIFLLPFLLVLESTQAGSKEPEAAFFTTPWQSKCQETPPSKEKVCILEKYLFEDRNQRNRIGGIGVRTSNQNKNTVITIISPLGISLSPGLEIGSNGGKVTTRPFIFCDNGGCISQFVADEKFLSLLSNEKEISLTYQLLNGKKIIINIDLENFKSLYSQIKQ